MCTFGLNTTLYVRNMCADEGTQSQKAEMSAGDNTLVALANCITFCSVFIFSLLTSNSLRLLTACGQE